MKLKTTYSFYHFSRENFFKAVQAIDWCQLADKTVWDKGWELGRPT
jgi:hypothetical protein